MVSRVALPGLPAYQLTLSFWGLCLFTALGIIKGGDISQYFNIISQGIIRASRGDSIVVYIINY